MTEQVNLEEVKTKLIQRLTASGWTTKLRGFIQSSDFDKVLEALYKERENGKRFTPPLKQVFSAFENCPVNNLRVIMVGQDPYPQLGVADGMAFSCSNTLKPQPSLQKIFDAVKLTVYPYEHIPDMNPDLTRWANQGVLLLNTALTCRVDQVGSHYNIWHDFLMYVMDILNFTDSGLIFVLMGKQAQELEDTIGPQHYIIKTTHPAYASYSKQPWDSCDIFNKINKIIKGQNGPDYQITW